MKQLTSKYLTEKHPLWAGCTLQECLLAGIPMLLGFALAGLILGACLNQKFLCLLIFCFLSFPVSAAVLKSMGVRREGKQAGFLMMRFYRWCNKYLGFNMPYVVRAGKWSNRR